MSPFSLVNEILNIFVIMETQMAPTLITLFGRKCYYCNGHDE